jgi:serine/threonine protein kinase
VLYEMATGAHPFGGTTTAAIFDGILHKAPRPPIELNPNVPTELERIIKRAVEKRRASRYQSTQELRDDLNKLKVQLGSGSTAMPVAQIIRKPRIAVGVIAFVVVLALIGTWVYKRQAK